MLFLMACQKGSDIPATTQIVHVYVDSTQLPGNAIADVEGNVYSTVTIGQQRWMSENLRTTHYANGDPIPYEPNNWSSAQSGIWTTYNNDANYNALYGKLYNWYVVMDPRGACPAGWHVPSDGEWQELELNLGMTDAEVQIVGSRGADVNAGGKLKSTVLWNTPNSGANDSTGFHAQAGGVRSTNPNFSSIGTLGSWWSLSELNSNDAWRRTLFFDNAYVNRSSMPKWMGISIRCVED